MSESTPPRSLPHQSLFQRFHFGLALVALAAGLCILGARWKVFENFGSDLPEWDQWDAEGLNSLKPWFEKSGYLKALFLPHNEHVVALTKLFNLALTIWNGQWDQRLEVFSNAFFPAILAGGLTVWSRKLVPAKTLPVVAVFAAALWALPFAWHNMLAGFHSQQFFLILLSLLAIHNALAPAGSGKWWIFVASAVLVLGSMASGVFAPLTIIILLGLELLMGRRSVVKELPTLLVCGLLFAVGWSMKAYVPGHAFLKAKSLSDVVLSLVNALGWPFEGHWWAPIMLWAPWTTFAVLWFIRGLRNRDEGSIAACALVGFGVWVLFQHAGAAVLRGADGAPPAARYLDGLAVGVFCNGLSLLILANERQAARFRKFTVVFGASWAILLGAGSVYVVRLNMTGNLPVFGNWHHDFAPTTRTYLRTQNPAYIHEGNTPYPDPEKFILRIKEPSLRNVLPSSVRPAFADLKAATNEHFQRPSLPPTTQVLPPGWHDGLPLGVKALGHEPIWTSYSEALPANTGVWESEPLTCPEECLRIEVVGTFWDEKIRLEVIDASTREVLARLKPRFLRSLEWQPAYAWVGSRAFRLRATDGSTGGWLAFSNPTEMPRGSYIALKTMHEGLWFLYAGAGVWLLGSVLILLPRSKRDV